MRANEFLNEARRAPEQNPKASVNSVLASKLAQTHDRIGDTKNLFVSLNSIEKLGINPRQPEFFLTTPVGIYAYPGEYAYKRIGPKFSTYSKLPFSGDHRYLNLFSVDGNVINLKTITDSEVADLVASIKHFALSHSVSPADIDSIVQLASEQSKKNSGPGGAIWYISEKVARLVAKTRGNNSNYASVWNKLWRSIGIDGVIDLGGGIIHSNEKTQAVFFHNGIIKDLLQVPNKYSPELTAASTEVGQYNKQVYFLNKVATPEELVEVLTNSPDLVDKVSPDRITNEMRMRIIQNSPIPTVGSVVLRHTPAPNNDLIYAAVSRSPEAISYVDAPTEQLQLQSVKQSPVCIHRIARPSEAAQLAAIALSPAPILHLINNATPAARQAHYKKWKTDAR